MKVEASVDLEAKILDKMMSLTAFLRPVKSTVGIAIEAVNDYRPQNVSLSKEFCDICDDHDS